MHATMINASITAYSTAVGPSSRFKKSVANRANLQMFRYLWKGVIRPANNALVWLHPDPPGNLNPSLPRIERLKMVFDREPKTHARPESG
jgi:hypothetical protein